MKHHKHDKRLVLSKETLRQITGGFPSTFGSFSATLRTGQVATQTMPGGTSPDEASFGGEGVGEGGGDGGLDV